MKLFVSFDDQLNPKDGQNILLSDIDNDTLSSYLSTIDQYDSVYFFGAEHFFQKIVFHELSDDFFNLVSKSYDEENPTSIMANYTLVVDASFDIPGVVSNDNSVYRINGEEINVIEISSDVTNENFETVIGDSLSNFEFMYIQ